MDDIDEFDEIDVLDDSLDPTYRGNTPSVITALCILTFIGSAFIIIKDLFLLYYYGKTGEIPGIAPLQLDEIHTFLDSVPLIYLLEIVTCIGTVIGAALMLNLKKLGFTIYWVSTVLYCLTIIFYWVLFAGIDLNEWLGILLVAYLAAPIGFLILYGSNKYYFR